MADDPFDPKYSLGLLGLLGAKPKGIGAAYDLLSEPAPSYSSGGAPSGVAASGLFPPLGSSLAPPYSFGSGLSGVAASDLFPPFGSSLAPFKAAIKRKAFFSFHYDDIMRVNVVRNAWKTDHPDNALMRSFQDSSLWESRKLEGDDAVSGLSARAWNIHPPYAF